MKSRTFLALSAVAALVIGLGPAGKTALAQDKDSQSDCTEAPAATQIARAQVQQAVSTQIAEALAQARTSAVTQQAVAVLRAKIVAARADVQALREQAVVAAQQAQTASPKARIVINGQDVSPMEETGWLGVSPDDVSADRAKELKLASARGVYVEQVEKDSPAEKAGLKSGDVITEFNGEHVEGVVQFRRLVRETPPGRSAALTVWRDGRSQTLNATLSTVSDQFNRQFSLNVPSRNFVYSVPMPATPPMSPMPQGNLSWNVVPSPNGSVGSYQLFLGSTPTIGINGQNLSGQLGAYFGAPDGLGVLVQDVQPDSPAEKAGVKAGDVITKLDGERVKTLGDFQAKLREKHEEKSVQLGVLRRGSETTVTVEPTKPATTSPKRAGPVVL